MKFGDKLTILRKRNGLSQEDLGEKLNVTRQTVSKWELGQTKPDTDKLMEISKLLNIDFNVLIDDSLSLDSVDNNISSNSNTYSNVVIDDEVRPRKWLLVILIIITIGLVIFLLNGYVTNKKTEDKKGVFDLFGGFSDLFNEINFDVGDFNASYENQLYEQFAGTKGGISVESLLDHIITNNKTNKKRTITVIFEDINSSEQNEIVKVKRRLDTFTDYEVSFSYDDNGYIYEVTIDTIEEEEIEKEPVISDFEIRSFNSSYEMYAGSEFGVSITNLLDKVITNNKTKKEHIIRVIYKNINTTDENEIRTIKKSLNDWTDYEVILDYDDIGFVNQITIEN